MALGRMEAFDRDVFLHLFEQSGKSQSQLAVDCQVSRAVISNWIHGRNNPAPAQAPGLAEALNTTVFTLCNRTPETADLLDLRIANGFNGAQAAKAAGISSEQLHELEHAVNVPNLTYLDALAEPYHTDIDSIHRAWVNRRVRLFPGSLHRLSAETREALSPWADEEPDLSNISGR